MANLIALRGVFKQSENNVIFDADLDNTDVRKDNSILFNKLFVDDSGYKLVSSSPKVFSAIHKNDFTENFYISEEELNSYITGFINSVNTNIGEVINTAVKSGAEDDLNKSALDDSDVKLSLYRSFKSFYDKWISKSTTQSVSGGTTSGYFFNNYGTDTDGRMLFDHFSFITRGGSDIGHKAVIDVAYLSNLANKDTGQGSTQSLYQSLTELLGKNNFDFFALPSLIQYSSSDESVLTDIFRAFDGPLNPEPAKPGFVCLFVGGSSRTLDIPQSYCSSNGIGFNYVNDSFDINDPATYPEDIKNNGGITAFLIKYGQQTQNHFSSIQLDQSEFKETQESLLVIDALVNPKTGSQPSQAGKGNNIYDAYLTRSYSCVVESLGNMMIQPLMYFKLDNVPMFRGTYIIKNVTHDIKPHNVKTTFTGVRQPIVTVPVVTDAISLLDLSLIDANETSGTGGSSNSQPSQSVVNEKFDTNVDVGDYKNVADFDLFLYLSWQQGAGGAAQHYSLWKGNGKYKKYNKYVPATNIVSNWPSGYVSDTGVSASDVESLYKTDQRKLAEAFIDVQRKLYNVKKTDGLQKLNSDGANATGIKYSEIKKIFQDNSTSQGVSYEALAAFGNIENGLNSDTINSATFKGMFQVNKSTFSDILDNLSPKTGRSSNYTDWVPLSLYVSSCVPRILKNFKTFVNSSGFS